MADQDKVVVHKHFKMGRGRYRFIGIWSAPSRGLLEVNPAAFNSAMNQRPAHCTMSCDHCGTGIQHHFIIEDEDHVRFSVGSSCIEKLGQQDLVESCRAAELNRQKQMRQDRLREKRERKNREYHEQLDRQRALNGGLTDDQVLMNKLIQREQELRVDYAQLTQPITQLLVRQGGGFCNQLGFEISIGRMPDTGARKIILEVMAKQTSRARKKSAAYESALKDVTALYESIEAKCKALHDAHQAFLRELGRT